MKKLFSVTALIILVVISVLGYVLMQTFFPELGKDKMNPNERLALKKNIMVMGVDERPEDHDKGRSATLFVVMFDSEKKQANLLSIPRDTRVHIPKYGWDKINHAYAFGGRELSQKTVEEFLGIKIHNYVMVNFKGFEGLVDAIGGVDVNIERDMYYRDSWDGFTIDLKKGKQHLDGRTAIQFVRYRDEEGDIGRVRRQQKFFMSAYDKVASAGIILKVPGRTKQLASMIKTDMPVKDMVNLGRVLHSMSKEKSLKVATVPGEGRYINEVSYYIPFVKAMRKQMAEMQGTEMNEKYKEAADTLDYEYQAALERVEQGDKSQESKLAEEKSKDEKDPKNKSADEKTGAEQKENVKEAAKSKEKAEQFDKALEKKKQKVVRIIKNEGLATDKTVEKK